MLCIKVKEKIVEMDNSKYDTIIDDTTRMRECIRRVCYQFQYIPFKETVVFGLHITRISTVDILVIFLVILLGEKVDKDLKYYLNFKSHL